MQFDAANEACHAQALTAYPLRDWMEAPYRIVGGAPDNDIEYASDDGSAARRALYAECMAGHGWERK